MYLVVLRLQQPLRQLLRLLLPIQHYGCYSRFTTAAKRPNGTTLLLQSLLLQLLPLAQHAMLCMNYSSYSTVLKKTKAVTER